MTDHCLICKKPLTDFNSKMLGMGPICRAQYFKQPDLGLEQHAEFSVIQETPDYILIKDIGQDKKTVTNDVEYVLQKLDTILNIQNKRVFYIDSNGDRDEIIHAGGRFKCFKPAREALV